MMTRMKGRAALARLALAAASAAASLGLAGSAASASEVVVYTWGAGNEPTMDLFVEEAKKQLGPDITVRYEGPGYYDYWAQIRSRYAGSDGPCVITTQSDRTSTIPTLLAPIGADLKAAGRSAGEYAAPMIDGMTVKGELKGLPYDVSVMLIYYNKALFKKYGVPEPTDTFTTEQFTKAAAAISQGEDKGFAYGPGWFFFDPFIIAAGHSWATADNKLNLMDQGVVDVTQAYFDLAAKGYAKPITAGETVTQQDALATGHVGMILGGSWDYPTLKKALGADLGVAEVPSPDGNGPQTVIGSGYGVAESCPDKETAFKVVAALTSAETEKALVEKMSTVPAMKSVLPLFLEKQDPIFAHAVSNALANGRSAPTPDSWDKPSGLLMQYLPEGFAGSMSAKDMLQTVTDSVN